MYTMEKITDSYYRDSKLERAVGIFSLAILFLLALLFVFYKLVGFDEIVKNMYYGHSFGFLNDLIKYQQTKSIEHYIHLANTLFHYVIFMSLVFLGFANLLVRSLVFKKPPRSTWIFNIPAAVIKIKYSLIEKVSLFYIFIPTVLFCAGWLKLYFSIPIILIILAGAYLFIRNNRKAELSQEEFFTIPFPTAFLVLVLIFTVVLLCGVGGHTVQTYDYVKHNAFFRDLIEYDWPLGYSELGPEKESHVLVTYVGYYLPSAFVGKILGFKIAHHFSSIWAYLGVVLTVIWFYRIIGKATFFLALFFLFFSGLDIIGYSIIKGWPESIYTLKYLDAWLIMPGLNATERLFWIFPSNIFLLTLSPHHILPGWLIMLTVLYYGFIRKNCSNLLFLSSACLVSSAFFSVGLLPYVFIAIIFTKAKKLFTFQNIIAGPLIVLVMGLFVVSNNGNFPHGWIWNFHNMWDHWPTLALFYFLEFGLYILVCPKIDEDNCHIPYKLLKWTCITLLLIWPWYLAGYWSDFTSKTATPSLLVLAICIGVAIINAKGEKQLNKAAVLKVLLIIGAFSGLFYISRSLDHGVHLRGNNFKNARHIDEFAEDYWQVRHISFGDPTGSIFWDYMAAEPSMN